MTLKARLQKLEQQGGFLNRQKQAEYFRYARMLDNGIRPDQLNSPADYHRILKRTLKPIRKL